MNTIKLTMGEKIDDLIKSHNIDASTLALETGISKATISDMIRDVGKGYDYRYFLKIAQYFNVSTDYLLGLTDAPTTNADLRYICDYTGLEEKTIKILNRLKNSTDKELSVIYKGSLTKSEYLFFLKVMQCILITVEPCRAFATYYSALTNESLASTQENEASIGIFERFYGNSKEYALYTITKSITEIIEGYGNKLFEKEFQNEAQAEYYHYLHYGDDIELGEYDDE